MTRSEMLRRKIAWTSGLVVIILTFSLFIISGFATMFFEFSTKGFTAEFLKDGSLVSFLIMLGSLMTYSWTKIR